MFVEKVVWYMGLFVDVVMVMEVVVYDGQVIIIIGLVDGMVNVVDVIGVMVEVINSNKIGGIMFELSVVDVVMQENQCVMGILGCLEVRGYEVLVQMLVGQLGMSVVQVKFILVVVVLVDMISIVDCIFVLEEVGGWEIFVQILVVMLEMMVEQVRIILVVLLIVVVMLFYDVVMVFDEVKGCEELVEKLVVMSGMIIDQVCDLLVVVLDKFGNVGLSMNNVFDVFMQFYFLGFIFGGKGYSNDIEMMLLMSIFGILVI